VILAALWEIWNWSDDDITFFAVVALLFGAYGGGYWSATENRRSPPLWVVLAVIVGMIGFVALIALYSEPCEPGECERPGP
jgi:H+/Cl- antiporter ClcA